MILIAHQIGVKPQEQVQIHLDQTPSGGMHFSLPCDLSYSRNPRCSSPEYSIQHPTELEADKLSKIPLNLPNLKFSKQINT